MKRSERQKTEERRRLQGGRLLLKGVRKIDVARRCGVSPTSVTRWAEVIARSGLDGLRVQRPRGRQSNLDPKRHQEVIKLLKRGAVANGFATELWTLPRISTLIEREFGYRHSGAQVSRMLARLGWSCQRPSGRAIQRDEAAIQRWKAKRWPALKKTLPSAVKPSSSSTNRD